MEKVISFEFEGQKAEIVVDSPAMKNVVVSMGGFSADLKSTSGEFRAAAEKVLEEEGVSPAVGQVIEWSDRGPVGFVYSGEVSAIEFGHYNDNLYRVKVQNVLNMSGVVSPVSGNLEMVVPFSALFAHKQVTGGNSIAQFSSPAASVPDAETEEPVVESEPEKAKGGKAPPAAK